MVVLDTDHMTFLYRDTMEAFNLERRLASVPNGEVVSTIVTYEEQMRGWLAHVAQSKSIDQEIQAYRRLRELVDKYKVIPLLDYNEASALIF
jgi:tRNA(fMet)-specific endonuclease VapC